MAEAKKVAEESAPAPSKKKKIILIVAILLILASLGGAGYWFFLKKPATDDPHAASEEVSQEKPVFEKLDTFVVNLAGGTALLQVELQAELTLHEDSQRVQDYMPKIRSALILLLSSKTADELATPEGKIKLNAQVKRLMNEAMNAGEKEIVKSVLFTSFIIQSQ